MNRIKNLIGMLIRDIVVYHSGDWVEYYVENRKYFYKTSLPFSFSIGDYTFLKSKDYDEENN